MGYSSRYRAGYATSQWGPFIAAIIAAASVVGVVLGFFALRHTSEAYGFKSRLSQNLLDQIRQETERLKSAGEHDSEALRGLSASFDAILPSLESSTHYLDLAGAIFGGSSATGILSGWYLLRRRHVYGNDARGVRGLLWFAPLLLSQLALSFVALLRTMTRGP
jgi:hypothetical protein